MAVKEDYDNLRVAIRRWLEQSDRKPGGVILTLSPDDTQERIIYDEIGTATYQRFLQRHWDLNEPWPGGEKPELTIACNVFHYSPNPALWFANVLGACKELWLQDLVWRPRGTSQLGVDGDKARYCLGNLPIQSNATYFNLNLIKDRILDYWTYDAGSLRAHRTMVNFVARLKGDL